MATQTNLEKLALELPESQRAKLAARILASLPEVVPGLDDGEAEALRRDAELEQNPQMGISLEELDQLISKRRRS